MTPTQLDHLRLLKSHLTTLLEVAKMRTRGEWVRNYGHNPSITLTDYETTIALVWSTSQDATFIAACAGNAEAGWKSTLAAINRYERMSKTIAYVSDPTMSELALKQELHLLKCEILAEWTIETLQK